MTTLENFGENTNPSPNEALSEPDKLAAIREIVARDFDGLEPDVFFSYSGGTGPIGRGGEYRSLSYSSLSEHGIATGGRTRVIATAEIAKALPNVPIITTSFNRFNPEEPTMASVLKGELIKRGVSRERIEEEAKSFSTVTQLTEMVKLAVERGWKRVAVMTNEYHHPRMQGMYERLDSIIDDADFQKTLAKFKEQGTKVAFVDAEPVMRLIDPHFVTYLSKVARTPQFQKTLETEAKGMADLKAGKYQVVLKPEAPRLKE